MCSLSKRPDFNIEARYNLFSFNFCNNIHFKLICNILCKIYKKTQIQSISRIGSWNRKPTANYTVTQQVVVEKQEAARGGGQRPGQPEEQHEGETLESN